MKILIAETGNILSDIVKQIVKSVPGPKIIDEVSKGNVAYSKICKNNYDFVVLDAALQEMSGLDILKNIKENNIRTRALIYSSFPNERHAQQAFRFGASGYLSKNSAFEVLKMAVGQAAEGEDYLSSIKAESKSSKIQISEKMYQVMVMFKNGSSMVENCALTVHVG
jgi:two-component system, NarL family, invasion response regulator UvrY